MATNPPLVSLNSLSDVGRRSAGWVSSSDVSTVAVVGLGCFGSFKPLIGFVDRLVLAFELSGLDATVAVEVDEPAAPLA